MARKTANFFDLHAEKLALGLCALMVVGAAVYSLGGSRFAVNNRGPAQLCQAVGDAAEQARMAVQNARPGEESRAKKDPANDPVALLKKWYGESAEGLIRIAQVEPKLPRTQPFSPPYVPISGDSSESQRNLAQIVSPDIPIVMAGEAVMEFPEEKPELPQWDGRGSPARRKVQRSYVSVAAQVDLVVQDANFRAENYPDGSYLEIVQVHLQRRNVNDPRRGWEDVNTWLPFKPFDRPKLIERAGGSFRFEGLDTFRSMIEKGAEAIARPKLPSTAAVLPPVPYLDEPPKPPGTSDPEALVRKWMEIARAAITGKRPFREPDLDAAYILARAAAWLSGTSAKTTETAQELLKEIVGKIPRSRRDLIQTLPRTQERLMPIVAHDLDAEPGNTYVYRMRYEVYNVYAGNPGELANPEDARRLTVFSGWSPESRRVEVSSDTYFYLTKADAKRGDVTVTVFKVDRRRGVEKKEYRVRVGEPIGRKERSGTKTDFSTGMVCVDLDFQRLVDGKQDVAMVYMDSADGVLRERIFSYDRRDKNLQKLLEDRSAVRN